MASAEVKQQDKPTPTVTEGLFGLCKLAGVSVGLLGFVILIGIIVWQEWPEALPYLAPFALGVLAFAGVGVWNVYASAPERPYRPRPQGQASRTVLVHSGRPAKASQETLAAAAQKRADWERSVKLKVFIRRSVPGNQTTWEAWRGYTGFPYHLRMSRPEWEKFCQMMLDAEVAQRNPAHGDKIEYVAEVPEIEAKLRHVLRAG